MENRGILDVYSLRYIKCFQILDDFGFYYPCSQRHEVSFFSRN